jgi:hypothetical protein
MDLKSTVLRQRIAELQRQSVNTETTSIQHAQWHKLKITNLQCIELHISIPMSKSLNHSSNSLFRTEQKSAKIPLNLRNEIHIPRFFRANFITDILYHPENQFPCPGPASQKTNSSDPTHQNIFPILRCQVFIRRLGCREITRSVT